MVTKQVKRFDYSLCLNIDNLDGVVRPQRVVCLNALAFLKGCWELFDLIPLSKVLGVKGKAHISALYIIKGLLTPKVTNLSFFFHPHAFPNQTK